MHKIEGQAPPKSLPKIWGDYNACGLSGDENDNCIYSLDRETLDSLVNQSIKLVFVYEDDTNESGQPEVFGYVCELEEVEGFISNWRAKPDLSTWYRGPKMW